MTSGVLMDIAGNAYSGLSASEYYFNVADSSAPSTLGFSPAHASTGVSTSTAIVLTFSEGIQVCVCMFADMCSALWLR